VVRALETICIVVLGLTACYEPPQPDCGFYCGAGGSCPENYTCTSDNRCRRNGATDLCEPDAGVVGRDSRPADAPPDADVTPPQLTFSSPANNAVNVSTLATIIVSFTEPVYNVSSLTMSVFNSNVGVISGTIAPIGTPADYTSYEMTPSNLLPANATITVTLTNEIYDTVGNALVTPVAGQLQFSFSTSP